MVLSSRLRRTARWLVPDGPRSALAREAARLAFLRFMKDAFGHSFEILSPGPVPPADVFLKTNAKEEASFERKARKAKYGRNVYLASGYNAARFFTANSARLRLRVVHRENSIRVRLRGRADLAPLARRERAKNHRFGHSPGGYRLVPRYTLECRVLRQ